MYEVRGLGQGRKQREALHSTDNILLFWSHKCVSASQTYGQLCIYPVYFTAPVHPALPSVGTNLDAEP